MSPDRELVLRIASEEANAIGANLGDVLGMAMGRRSKIARQKAMARIYAETGCSNAGLARVWGCDKTIPGRYRRQPIQSLIYDADTCRRLQWAHGETRAAAIMGSEDSATRTDIAKWRALGGPV